MQQEKQDQLIQEFINAMNHAQVLNCKDYQESNNISLPDWNEMIGILLKRQLIHTNTYMVRLTPEGNTLVGNRYIDFIKKEREEEQLQLAKKEEQERKETEKREIDLTLAKWQKKTFWWVFSLGGIGGICGIISLSLQLTAAPVIEKKYIPIDSKGQIHELPEKKGA